MLYCIYMRPLGKVVLRLDTIKISGFFTYITGYDEDHNRIDFVMDRMRYLDDYDADCGYCHIVSYTTNGVTVPCNCYQALC